MSFEMRRQGFEPPDHPLIKRRRFWLLPAVSGCVRCSVGRQCFAYLITSCCRRSIPVDCVSFAPHKRHLPLSAPANLLQSSPTEHLGPSELETRCLAAGALTRPEKRPSQASGAPYSWENPGNSGHRKQRRV